MHKYKDHPSIVAIRNKFKGEHSFSFKIIEREELYKEILNLQPLTKILRQIADLQEKLTFQATWKVLNFSLEMTRLLKIEKWLEAWPLGCHPARNGHVTH